MWFSLAIPTSRHSVIGWMVALNKIPTKARLIQWGINVDSLCGFCRSSGTIFSSNAHSLKECGNPS